MIICIKCNKPLPPPMFNGDTNICISCSPMKVVSLVKVEKPKKKKVYKKIEEKKND